MYYHQFIIVLNGHSAVIGKQLIKSQHPPPKKNTKRKKRETENERKKKRRGKYKVKKAPQNLFGSTSTHIIYKKIWKLERYGLLIKVITGAKAPNIKYTHTHTHTPSVGFSGLLARARTNKLP